jgi:hypothetical protein
MEIEINHAIMDRRTNKTVFLTMKIEMEFPPVPNMRIRFAKGRGFTIDDVVYDVQTKNYVCYFKDYADQIKDNEDFNTITKQFLDMGFVLTYEYEI